ncbi:MAG: hypothetical protein HY329_01645 [Chloroflexi bacterium]|nr:hypothetical protein [Chloroflexota bacterium]
MTTKELLHSLVEQLPDEELDRARRQLEELIDPVLRALRNAPIDDEPETDEDDAGLQEAYADLASGRVHSLDEVKRELGLS